MFLFSNKPKKQPLRKKKNILKTIFEHGFKHSSNKTQTEKVHVKFSKTAVRRKECILVPLHTRERFKTRFLEQMQKHPDKSCKRNEIFWKERVRMTFNISRIARWNERKRKAAIQVDISGVTSMNDSPVAGGRRLDLWYRPTGQDLLL